LSRKRGIGNIVTSEKEQSLDTIILVYHDDSIQCNVEELQPGDRSLDWKLIFISIFLSVK
jgi:hypothetical protein